MRHGFTVGLLGALVLLLTTGGIASAQSPIASRPDSMALSPALSDLPDAHWMQGPQDLQVHPAPMKLPPRAAGSGSPNPAATQTKAGAHLPFTPQTNFAGIGANGYIPPDPNIAVGLSNIVQVVNSEFAVFDKSGNIVPNGGPKRLSTIWSALGGPCARNNAGDAVVQYDKLADNGNGRWIITQLGSVRRPFSECIAVSTSSNPLGTYALYSYSFGNNLNDYPKFGIWPTTDNSAYLATYNMFANGQTFSGAQLCAYDRKAMLAGQPATAVCQTIPNDGGYLPSDLDGSTPPSNGSPGYFLNFQMSSNSLRLYKLSPNFTTKTAALSAPVDITVGAFSEPCGLGGVCIPQKGTAEQLDSLGDRLMYRLAYRNFGAQSEAMVVNHSVAAGSSVGVRWYQLTSAAPGAFGLAQQQTFAPDSTYRWMGSMAMDQAGSIALGYSTSSSSSFPGIAVTGRTATMPLGTMGSENTLQAGGGSQTGYTRWGDYTSMRIDPKDDCTFWYTNEYYTANASFSWSSFIGSFKIPGGGTVCP
jgi:hypothetical protein